jgi:hypothetical protein
VAIGATNKSWMARCLFVLALIPPTRSNKIHANHPNLNVPKWRARGTCVKLQTQMRFIWYSVINTYGRKYGGGQSDCAIRVVPDQCGRNKRKSNATCWILGEKISGIMEQCVEKNWRRGCQASWSSRSVTTENLNSGATNN